MLVLTSEATGVAAYAVGKAKRDAYTISMNAAAVEKQLGKQVCRARAACQPFCELVQGRTQRHAHGCHVSWRVC